MKTNSFYPFYLYASTYSLKMGHLDLKKHVFTLVQEEKETNLKENKVFSSLYNDVFLLKETLSSRSVHS